jgi:hypothetical protein
MRVLSFRTFGLRALSFRSLDSTGTLSGVWAVIPRGSATWTRL